MRGGHFLVSYPDYLHGSYLFFRPGIGSDWMILLQLQFPYAQAKNLRKIPRHQGPIYELEVTILNLQGRNYLLKTSAFQRKKSNKRLNVHFNFRRVKLLSDVACSLRQWLILNASANNAKQHSKSLPYLTALLEEISL